LAAAPVNCETDEVLVRVGLVATLDRLVKTVVEDRITLDVVEITISDEVVDGADDAGAADVVTTSTEDVVVAALLVAEYVLAGRVKPCREAHVAGSSP
jgi:hypothetical protein